MTWQHSSNSIQEVAFTVKKTLSFCSTGLGFFFSVCAMCLFFLGQNHPSHSSSNSISLMSISAVESGACKAGVTFCSADSCDGTMLPLEDTSPVSVPSQQALLCFRGVRTAGCCSLWQSGLFSFTISERLRPSTS